MDQLEEMGREVLNSANFIALRHQKVQESVRHFIEIRDSIVKEALLKGEIINFDVIEMIEASKIVRFWKNLGV